ICYGDLGRNNEALVEHNLIELLHDAPKRTLPRSNRLYPKNSGRDDDLPVVAEIGSQDIRHVGVTESRDRASREIQVELVIELESRLDHAGLDARSIDARDNPARTSRPAISIGVRRGLNFAGPYCTRLGSADD